MKGPFGLIQDYIFDLVADKAKEALAPVGRIVRRFSIGTVVIIISSIAWTISLLFLLLSLFFAQTPYGNLAGPALWTGLAAIAIGIILTVIGFSFFRHPRY